MPHLLVLLLSCKDNEKAKPAEKMAAALGLLDGASRVCLRRGFDRSDSPLTPPKSAKIICSSPAMVQTLKERGKGSSKKGSFKSIKSPSPVGARPHPWIQ